MKFEFNNMEELADYFYSLAKEYEDDSKRVKEYRSTTLRYFEGCADSYKNAAYVIRNITFNQKKD
jgi:hypothetical protein